MKQRDIFLDSFRGSGVIKSGSDFIGGRDEEI